MKSFLLAGFALFLPSCLLADPSICGTIPCGQVFQLTSLSESRSYGLLLAAPDAGCRRVRYRVETPSDGFLGHTPPLGPGEVAVVRMGRGFSAGPHPLIIAAEGCKFGPSLTRRVTLAKLSPDHGWRAVR